MFVFLFRSLKLAVIALLPSILSSMSVLGVMGAAGLPLDMMTITIVAISVGIAVDNTIHYVHRFKAEFPLDRDYSAALKRSHGSIGNAMYYTSVTIIIGFSILAFSNFIPSVLFGLLTGMAMAVALVSSLSLLPQLLVVFRVFGPGSQRSG
jgi:predicted RND superfamily exporter protein